MQFTDVMVDIETTGTAINDVTGILQIAAIKFCHDTDDIGPSFDRCLALAPNRHWDESTKQWWTGQKRATFDGIVARMEDPAMVMKDFYLYATEGSPEGGYRFWSKPMSFDFPLVASYFRQHSLPMPFHFRTARDLNTYIAAKHGGADHQKMDHIELVGEAHNALADCVYQLKCLYAARDGKFGPQTIEHAG